MEKKHAYLIMAHNKFNQLKMLLNCLDDERNDIFLLIDKKSNFDISDIRGTVKNASLKIYNEKSVFWGGYSIIDAELFLLEKAIENKHKYYHLLSGMDLPIKSQDFIHEFFDNTNKEFIAFEPTGYDFAKYKTQYYHYFVESSKYRNSVLRKGLRKGFVELQKIFGINRVKNITLDLKYGSQWFSITDDFARYVFSQKDFIEKVFKNTLACDEVFLQSIAYNSNFRESIYLMKDGCEGNMRYIDWDRKEGNSPYTFRNEDYNALIESNKLFARKFDIDRDLEIIERICEHVK